VLLVYLLPIFPQLVQPPDSDQYHSQLPWQILYRVYSNGIFCLSICDQFGCQSSHQERSRFIYEGFGEETS